MINLAAHFGGNLARCRKRVGLSQEELAVRASIHRTAVGMIERGERVARVDTLVKIAASLEVSADELLAGIVWSPGDYQPGGFTTNERGEG